MLDHVCVLSCPVLRLYQCPLPHVSEEGAEYAILDKFAVLKLNAFLIPTNLQLLAAQKPLLNENWYPHSQTNGNLY